MLNRIRGSSVKLKEEEIGDARLPALRAKQETLHKNLLRLRKNLQSYVIKLKDLCHASLDIGNDFADLFAQIGDEDAHPFAPLALENQRVHVTLVTQGLGSIRSALEGLVLPALDKHITGHDAINAKFVKRQEVKEKVLKARQKRKSKSKTRSSVTTNNVSSPTAATTTTASTTTTTGTTVMEAPLLSSVKAAGLGHHIGSSSSSSEVLGTVSANEGLVKSNGNGGAGVGGSPGGGNGSGSGGGVEADGELETQFTKLDAELTTEISAVWKGRLNLLAPLLTDVVSAEKLFTSFLERQTEAVDSQVVTSMQEVARRPSLLNKQGTFNLQSSSSSSSSASSGKDPKGVVDDDEEIF